MGYQGYIVRIVFVVVVAVAYSYKSEISEVVSTALKSFRGKNEAPSRKNTIPPHTPIKAPEPDYHNPTFDPDHPPEPLYSKSGVRLVTKNELKAHGSDGPLEPIWLAMMGKVFDVNQGAEHYYGPKGGYKFFSGTIRNILWIFHVKSVSKILPLNLIILISLEPVKVRMDVMVHFSFRD